MKRKFKQWSSIAANKANKKRSQQTIDLNINGTTYGIVNPGSVLGQIQKCHVIKQGMILSLSDKDDGYFRSASFPFGLITSLWYLRFY
jgi:hypothetical protein